MKSLAWNGFVILCVGTLSNSMFASTTTIGPNGINSAGLTLANGMPLTGALISIGQVEISRPGKRVADGGFDSEANSNTTIKPANVFVGTTGGASIANMQIDDHATQVAGVMISTETTDPDGMGPMVAPTGVATSALLFSSAFTLAGPDFDADAAIAAQHIANQDGGLVRAINMSFVNPRVGGHVNDGDQKLTQFIDWSATQHDVLYVVAFKNTLGSPAINTIPTDNFNGMTIGRSTRVGAVYLQVSAGNDFSADAEGDRTSIALIAPGDGVDVTGRSNVAATVNGASFAAPHVAGTVALLQQYARDRINAGASGWDGDARRHEVMKAVLMNSADKFIDDGTVTVPGGLPIPPGGLLGMERTVIDVQGLDWFQSEAYDDSAPLGFGRNTALDDQIGAGHLNAKRARQQFSTGEWDANSLDVPVTGWDFGHTTGLNNNQEYVFSSPLLQGSFISITVAWDRRVIFENDTAPTNVFNATDTFQESEATFPTPDSDEFINDLDIWLLPADGATLFDAVAQAQSPDGTLEHLFFQVPTTGEYNGVAWKALAELTSFPQGDYNGDQVVDAADYGFWQTSFGDVVAAGTGADGNVDGRVNAADFVIWRKNVSAGSGSGTGTRVPEPASGLLLLIAGAFLILRRSAVC